MKTRELHPLTHTPTSLPDELRYLLFSSSYESIQEILQTSAGELERLHLLLEHSIIDRHSLKDSFENYKYEVSRDNANLRTEVAALRAQLTHTKQHYYMTVTSGPSTTGNILLDSVIKETET